MYYPAINDRMYCIFRKFTPKPVCTTAIPACTNPRPPCTGAPWHSILISSGKAGIIRMLIIQYDERVTA